MNLENLAYRILRRLRIQRSLNWTSRLPHLPVSVPQYGDTLGSAILFYRGSWKASVFRALFQEFQFRSVVDVGANEGQTILDLIEAGCSDVPVAAIEPNVSCAYYLQHLAEANGWQNVQILPFGLADSERCLTLELESENSSGGTLIENLRPGRRIARRQAVPCFSLDTLIETSVFDTEPGFLCKIDVEGGELDVIKGSLRTLETLRPIVVCEVLWAHNQERRDLMKSRNLELVRLLRSVGYEIRRLLLDRQQRSVEGLELITEFPDDVYGKDNAHLCDYLFVPSESAARVERLFRG